MYSKTKNTEQPHGGGGMVICGRLESICALDITCEITQGLFTVSITTLLLKVTLEEVKRRLCH